MQVNFDGHVTEITGKPIKILRVEIRKPSTVAALAVLSNNHDARREQALEPHECAEVRATFFVKAVLAEIGKPWRASVVFIDQFGNRHKVKNCEFRSLQNNKPPVRQEPEEFPYEIADPVEKEVVSVLKAELSRYAVCGRSCGGLGSIYIIYGGHTFTGVGVGGWKPNSPLNQVIASDPEAASLESDNLKALVNFYRGLSIDEERSRFVEALLTRLDKSRGYLGVSYFIVAVLWKVGSLNDALQKVKRDLPEDDTRSWGFSNVLMLLDGLLRYRHPDFTNPMLDEIERLTHGLKEHAFSIPAKLAAIRANRLLPQDEA